MELKFGKYKGQKIEDVVKTDRNYVEWLKNESKYESVKSAAKAVLLMSNENPVDNKTDVQPKTNQSAVPFLNTKVSDYKSKVYNTVFMSVFHNLFKDVSAQEQITILHDKSHQIKSLIRSYANDGIDFIEGNEMNIDVPF